MYDVKRLSFKFRDVNHKTRPTISQICQLPNCSNPLSIYLPRGTLTALRCKRESVHKTVKCSTDPKPESKV